MAKQLLLDVHKELIVDLFAGGGGFSQGVFMASGRHPDIAINHNDDALSMHRANHPQTRHFVADVFEVCPKSVTQGRPVGHLHLSPDCTHHSQARGGQPRNEKIRGLSWVGVRWAGQVKPRVITLENVHQVELWGRLIAKRDKTTGRVIKLDGSVAAAGERVPREFQHLIPDPKRKGETWNNFKSELEALGYDVKHQHLKACDNGAGTKRNRLFMIARCDGIPITFPAPTHFKKPAKGQKRWSPAYEHIDFGIESKSIFDRKKPLKDPTLRRVAKGIKRFVIDSADPFIVPVTHSKSNNVQSIHEPLNTITTSKGGEFALASPVLIQAGHGEGKPGGVKRWGSGSNDVNEPLGTITASGDHSLAIASMIQMGYGEAKGQKPRVLDINEPIGTVVAGGGKFGLVAAHIAQMNGGFYNGAGNDAREPLSTITNTGSQQQLVTAHLCTFRNNQDAEGVDEPISTICTSGAHHGLVECTLEQDENSPSLEHTYSQEIEEKALRVANFLISYYGTDNMSSVDEPLPTITTKDRLALVTVIYNGKTYLIVDIKLRMLTPPELYSAQGFPKDYIITHGHDGRKFSLAKQTKMCGNSVSPYSACALFLECHQDDELRLVA